MKQDEVCEYIVAWINRYTNNNKIETLVVGVSGGVDSAVTSTLCAKTNKSVICVEMPIHQEMKQVSRARNHINWLKKNYTNVDSHDINLTSTYEHFIAQMPSSENIKKETLTLAKANQRARLRMTTLYYVAGINGGLVVGTGNKIEDFGIGFFTKYGDGGVDISPIADLTKTQVFQLATFLGIHKDILLAPPTDGLFGDERTDEKQIGATYPELEWAMEQYEKGEKTESFQSSREQEVFDIFMNRHTQNQHKMKPIPICEIPNELLK